MSKSRAQRCQKAKSVINVGLTYVSLKVSFFMFSPSKRAFLLFIFFFFGGVLKQIQDENIIQAC